MKNSGWQASQRKDNIKKWGVRSVSSLLCIADDRDGWAVMTAQASDELDGLSRQVSG